MYRVSKKEMWHYFKPMIIDKDMKRIFYKSMIFLALSKSLAIASPFFIKITVNALAEASKLDLNLAVMGILAFGASRILSSLF